MRIYTDGGCSPNPGPGAWAFYVDDGVRSQGESGYESMTTNNRMEIMGVLKALEWCVVAAVKAPVIHSDSQYTIKGCSEWLPGWKRRGWVNSTQKPVMNRDLWEKVDALLKMVRPTFQWVRGHSGHPMNDLVDSMCTEAITAGVGRKHKAHGALA